jgi:hypothetical protein
LPVGATDADVDSFLNVVPDVVRRIRAVAGAEEL